MNRTRKNRQIKFAPPFRPLFRPARYKVYYGGRGGGKSWTVARALIIKGLQSKIRVLCAREFQTSIADSVHKLLSEQIEALGLSPYYEVQKTRIIGLNGTEFIFKGLRHNVQEIKSTEGVDYCWIEEASSVSEESWAVLVPTIRQAGSEIWMTFNPQDDDDPTYKKFVLNPPPNSVVRKVSWRDNPHFPQVLRDEMEYLQRVDPDAYAHVWEGETRTISDAVILRGKTEVRAFETPDSVDRFYIGADWGFSQDPTAMVRCFVLGNVLYVDHEAYAIGCDIDKTPALFDRVPESRKWPIYADSARPETISYMRRAGFNISAAEKWGGSVEDGIAFLRSFERIVIHERCKHVAEEARLYKYRVDQRTGEVLPVVVDANNHCIDALRYSLVKLIRGFRKPLTVNSFTGEEYGNG
jgi:phage terminase large subunit